MWPQDIVALYKQSADRQIAKLEYELKKERARAEHYKALCEKEKKRLTYKYC